jgi:hypothetical protein
MIRRNFIKSLFVSLLTCILPAQKNNMVYCRCSVSDLNGKELSSGYILMSKKDIALLKFIEPKLAKLRDNI